MSEEAKPVPEFGVQCAVAPSAGLSRFVAMSAPAVSGPRLPRPAELYQALVTRDVSYEGIFVAAIRTTGIFCRPTCPSRKPLAQNVEFFARSDDALSAGYRPCQRCRPMELAGQHPEWVDRLIGVIDRAPNRRLSDGALRKMNIQPATARRYFRERFGMTVHGYARARQLGFALDKLREGTPVTPAGFDSGFESDSGFRDAFKRLFGTTPAAARDTSPIQATLLPSPLGPLLAAATERGLCMLEFADRKKLPAQAADLARWYQQPVIPGSHRFIEQARTELAEYFAGERSAFEVPLDVKGTEFQERVWQELLRIPYGTTISYETLATRIGRVGAQRAVGLANGKNRIPIIIPCHRVIQKNGQLRGYGGGLWRKQYLLDLEQQAAGNRQQAEEQGAG
jgi:AraC family transcriptional regulator of adaptative response/methylated-DNA-[protein]-cysteine methyltransferase